VVPWIATTEGRTDGSYPSCRRRVWKQDKDFGSFKQQLTYRDDCPHAAAPELTPPSSIDPWLLKPRQLPRPLM